MDIAKRDKTYNFPITAEERKIISALRDPEKKSKLLSVKEGSSHG